MSQKTKGIHSLLSSTFFYSLSQKLMSGTSFRKKIVKKIIAKNNLKILDIGCGPAEILESLPKVEYYGYDISQKYINHAKKKYKDRGSFFCKKFSNADLKKLPKFDYVLLLGILHHLSDREIQKLMKMIKKVLVKKGQLITIDPVFTKNQNPIAKFFINVDRGNNVRNKRNYTNLIKKSFKKIKAQIHQQKFIPYTWFVSSSKN